MTQLILSNGRHVYAIGRCRIDARGAPESISPGSAPSPSS
jgi:hypothetical protein